MPTNAVKVPDDDTGYKLVKKHYRRFLWTWNNPPRNQDDYKLDEQTVGDNVWPSVNLGEVPGMGRSDHDWIPDGTVGFRNGPMSKPSQIPFTDEYMDPDLAKRKKSKLKNLKAFEDFDK